MRTDEQIQQDIMAQLRWEPILNAAEIGVSVKKGIVTLSGEVDSYFKKVTAENAAKMISGVRAIADDIQIGVSPQHDKTDAEIAEAVATALTAHRHVEERKIRVTVDKGVVTLEGTANWNFQRAAAAEVVKVLKGVRGINNHIIIKPAAPPGEVKKSIEESIARYATLDPEKITVEVQDSKVILRGSVRSLSEGDDAEYAAWSAPGVTAVENRLMLDDTEL